MSKGEGIPVALFYQQGSTKWKPGNYEVLGRRTALNETFNKHPKQKDAIFASLETILNGETTGHCEGQDGEIGNTLIMVQVPVKRSDINKPHLVKKISSKMRVIIRNAEFPEQDGLQFQLQVCKSLSGLVRDLYFIDIVVQPILGTQSPMSRSGIMENLWRPISHNQETILLKVHQDLFDKDERKEALVKHYIPGMWKKYPREGNRIMQFMHLVMDKAPVQMAMMGVGNRPSSPTPPGWQPEEEVDDALEWEEFQQYLPPSPRGTKRGREEDA
jgi:hypothetical protein